MWGSEQDAFLEAMAEAGKSVSDYLWNGLHTLEHAEEIGLGSRTYTLVNIDE